MENVLKIGIIGCGAIGKDHCRRIIETVPGATVVAVSDYVAAAADDTAAKYGIKSYGNDCDGMIKDPEVEAVVITSIDPTHHDYVMKTLAEEKWCFCEKPLSQNAADCEDIIKREQEIGKRLVQVGFMRHYDRGYAEMKRIIDLRVDRMVAQGLFDEVRALVESGVPRTATAMQAIGYKECLGCLAGECTQDEAVAEIKLRSRQYAKRQLTWLRRNRDIHWFYRKNSRDLPAALQFSTEILTNLGVS